MLTQKERRSAEAIEDAIARDEWLRARRLIRAALSRKADDHWLLSRLALTYYEQRQYRRALNYELKALQIEPYCPLAIWGYAGTLDMLERRKEALELFRWLMSWGEDELAYGPSGEGIQRARSLIADCFCRIARIQEQMGQCKRALQSYNEHLSRRTRGTRSIYPLKAVKANMKALQERAKPSNSSIHKVTIVGWHSL
jgi:tetratricopeptide (TPR) repeat protein